MSASVLVLPYRNPVLAAKMLATIMDSVWRAAGAMILAWRSPAARLYGLDG